MAAVDQRTIAEAGHIQRRTYRAGGYRGCCGHCSARGMAWLVCRLWSCAARATMAAMDLPQPGFCALAVARRASSSRQTGQRCKELRPSTCGVANRRAEPSKCSARTWPHSTPRSQKADLVIDALLGTGLRGAPRPAMARVIERIAHCERPVVAVDIPSGVEADTGRVHGAAVQAVLTVTFGLVKVGQLFYPGRSHCGALHLANIGFPESILPRCGCPSSCCLPPRGWGRSCHSVAATSTRGVAGRWLWSRVRWA